MKITALTVQQRNKERISVFLDGDFFCSLLIDQMLEIGLKKEQEVDSVLQKKLLNLSETGKLWERLLDKLSRRLHSTKEIRDYLWRKKVDGVVSDALIARLQSNNLLDDRKFAEMWIRMRARGSRSARAIRAELRSKGIDIELINELMSDVGDNDIQALQKLIEKKATKYDTQQKLMAFLMRKGFSYSQIQEALNSREG